MTDVWHRQARNNTLRNQRLFKLCEGIPDAERKRDCEGLLYSIHGSLNYLLLADRIWMGRFKGKPLDYDDLIGDLHSDFHTLRVERERLDRHIEAWVNTLTPKRLQGTMLCHGDVGNGEAPLYLEEALVYFFNEQNARRREVGERIQVLCRGGVQQVVPIPSNKPGDLSL